VPTAGKTDRPFEADAGTGIGDEDDLPGEIVIHDKAADLF
jgi:hypothetical protein